MRKAVVDVGSNSLILTVFEQSGLAWEPVFETTRVTGLGRGTKSSGVLASDRATASLDALVDLAQEAARQGADDWTAGGTMALRIATDAHEFLEAASRQGTPVQVMSGEAEARLGFLAVAEDPTFRSAERLAILDPGGHSTELTLAAWTGTGWSTVFSRSFPVGALGLRETCLRTSAPPVSERLAAVTEVDSLVGSSDVGSQSGPAGQDGQVRPLEVVVLGATGTNLVSMREKMDVWEPTRVHGATLTYEEVSRSVGWLCDLDDQGRARLTGLERGRETTIHAGALVLERFLFALRAEACRVSVRGWRHALANHPEALRGAAV